MCRIFILRFVNIGIFLSVFSLSFLSVFLSLSSSLSQFFSLSVLLSLSSSLSVLLTKSKHWYIFATLAKKSFLPQQNYITMAMMSMWILYK
ncbi:hypothetical protein BD770DRAFT_161033 [Pilaira anomala]|nr:hypothetical protein BD770DRAFT_161033 [Pilaira anomala]